MARKLTHRPYLQICPPMLLTALPTQFQSVGEIEVRIGESRIEQDRLFEALNSLFDSPRFQVNIAAIVLRFRLLRGDGQGTLVPVQCAFCVIDSPPKVAEVGVRKMK